MTTPVEAIPALTLIKEEYDAVDDKKDIKEISEVLIEFFYEYFQQLGVTSVLEELINYINENQAEDDQDESDQEYPETRIKEFLGEIIGFMMECFHERMEVMFFFKTCFLNFDLDIH